MSEMQDLMIASGRADMLLHELPKGEILALANASGQLSVVAGRIWLTRPGDLDDHFLAAGESIAVGAGTGTLVEPWGERAATVAWRPAGLAARARRGFDRCWQLMNPFGRAALGSSAALTAVLVAVGLFGPLSEQRARSLVDHRAQTPVTHNAPTEASTVERRAGDVEFRSGSRRVAGEAGRRAAGAA